MFDIFSSDMRTPSVVSGALHVGLVVVALVGLPWFDRPPLPEPEPMIVDYEEIGQKAAAPVVAPPQPPSKAPIAKEVTAAPPPTTVDKPPTPAPEQAKPPEPPKPEKPAPAKSESPVKAPEPQKPVQNDDVALLKPKQPEPPVKEPPKPAPTVTQEPKKPDPKPEPPKVEKPAPPKPPPAPKPPEKTVDQILDNVLKNKDPNAQPHKPVQESPKPAAPTRVASTAPNYAARLTTSEMSAMADRVRPCWNINPDARDASAMAVEIIVDMQPDGMVSNAKVGDGIRINGPQHGAFAQAALRAVLNPRCQPLPYPQGKYDSLRQFIFRFDPRDL